ncbi:unnamed protein product [Phytophthora lilii]|uniref:Unnamed protein product n=1 Tax=Phytophthora lilii TaxID=2077276 RepID=A0A9W6X5W2_9STRA|nr:unnamed protein product [Phytophthora lilii]
MVMPWLAQHDPLINWRKRTVVRFGNAGQSVEDTTDRAIVSDGPGNAARASGDVCGLSAQTATSVAVSDDSVSRCERVSPASNLIGSALQGSATSGYRGDDAVSSGGVDNLIGSDLQGFSTSRLWGDDGASTNWVDVRIQSDMRGNPAIRHGCDETTSTQGVDANLIGSSSTGIGVESAATRRLREPTL